MKWHKEEVEYLVENYKKGIRVEDIARDLERSYGSVNSKINRMGLSETTKTNQIWTDDDIKMLKDHINVLSFRDIAELMGRTLYSVMCKAKEIGLYKKDIPERPNEVVTYCINCKRKVFVCLHDVDYHRLSCLYCKKEMAVWMGAKSKKRATGLRRKR